MKRVYYIQMSCYSSLILLSILRFDILKHEREPTLYSCQCSIQAKLIYLMPNIVHRILFSRTRKQLKPNVHDTFVRQQHQYTYTHSTRATCMCVCIAWLLACLLALNYLFFSIAYIINVKFWLGIG